MKYFGYICPQTLKDAITEPVVVVFTTARLFIQMRDDGEACYAIAAPTFGPKIKNPQLRRS